ncbi:hypothetical protein B0H65DRAFT_461027 [Neurospora tetraspora]|uniref:Uncharacterized protein n=1 Tax=Neurospora tetraspora TaxID=94610 RepID=A0AAE0JGW4_9PEZI|nr:hypothetical protein B0H65DRAFT_461027 [Neurospora tetraspora]
MSSSMHTSTKDIISMIERIDRHPHNMPAMKRIGYAVGIVGLAMQGGYTADEFKGTILDYIRTLRRELDFANSAEQFAQLRHREILCGDVLAALCELKQNATVHREVDVVVNQNSFVDEGNVDIGDFVLIHESDAGESQAESAEWELV